MITIFLIFFINEFYFLAYSWLSWFVKVYSICLSHCMVWLTTIYTFVTGNHHWSCKMIVGVNTERIHIAKGSQSIRANLCTAGITCQHFTEISLKTDIGLEQIQGRTDLLKKFDELFILVLLFLVSGLDYRTWRLSSILLWRRVLISAWRSDERHKSRDRADACSPYQTLWCSKAMLCADPAVRHSSALFWWHEQCCVETV